MLRTEPTLAIGGVDPAERLPWRPGNRPFSAGDHGSSSLLKFLFIPNFRTFYLNFQGAHQQARLVSEEAFRAVGRGGERGEDGRSRAGRGVRGLKPCGIPIFAPLELSQLLNKL